MWRCLSRWLRRVYGRTAGVWSELRWSTAHSPRARAFSVSRCRDGIQAHWGARTHNEMPAATRRPLAVLHSTLARLASSSRRAWLGAVLPARWRGCRSLSWGWALRVCVALWVTPMTASVGHCGSRHVSNHHRLSHLHLSPHPARRSTRDVYLYPAMCPYASFLLDAAQCTCACYTTIQLLYVCDVTKFAVLLQSPCLGLAAKKTSNGADARREVGGGVVGSSSSAALQ